MAPLARNVRKLREERGLSLSALASTAGVSKSTLFQLERGGSNPSVDTVWSLAKALAVPFSTLFVDDNSTAVDILRFQDAPLIAREGGRYVTAAEGQELAIRLLLNTPYTRETELYCVDFDAAVRKLSPPHSTGVIEHVFIAKGRLEVGVDGRSAVLDEGDIMTFAADQPHQYYALDGPARIVVILHYP
jgi:transcriptional regulator with XRE-family HTH domain